MTIVDAALALVPPTAEPRPPESGSPGRLTLARLLGTRSRLAGLLTGVFLFNLLETRAETWLRFTAWGEWTARVGGYLSEASSQWEWALSFANHDTASPTLSHGYSISYFLIFPLLFLGVAVALARRPQLSPFRIYSLALTLDYALSLPFFLLFPVIERWGYSTSGAILLSDKVSTSLIEIVRPMSGLDNCFPSFHVSVTVITILVAYLFRLRLWITVLCLGLTVVLSTFVLGIHWQADLVAGTAVGLLSVAGARRLDGKLVLAEGASRQAAEPDKPRLRAVPGGQPDEQPVEPPPTRVPADRAPEAGSNDLAAEASEAREKRHKIIFVSYRRNDAADLTDHLCARLEERFGDCRVFKDVDDIPPGANFKEYLTRKLHQCDVFLAVIGKKWLGCPEDGGQCRLLESRDLVGLEIEIALERKIPLIPVLVHDASMPTRDDLPPQLAELVYQNAIKVRRAPDFDSDIDKLGDGVEYYFSGSTASGDTGVYDLPKLP